MQIFRGQYAVRKPISRFRYTKLNLLQSARLSQNPSAVEFCLTNFTFDINEPIKGEFNEPNKGWYPLHLAAYPWDVIQGDFKYPHYRDPAGTLELLIAEHKKIDPNFDIESITTPSRNDVYDIACFNKEQSKKELFFLEHVMEMTPRVYLKKL